MITDEAWQAIMRPFAADAPCGPSLCNDPLMERLRELRREDDDSLPVGIWQSERKLADWAGVQQLAELALAERSKDLTIAAYLGEAWLFLDGLAGLAAALRLLVGLCERFDDDLHPLALGGDQSWRAAPLDWLVRRYADILTTRLPICPDWPQMTPHAWQSLQRRPLQAGDGKAEKAAAEAARLQQKKLDESVRGGKVGGWQAALAQLESASAELQALDAWCARSLGREAPSLQPLDSAIQSFTAIIKGLSNMAPEETSAMPADMPEAPPSGNVHEARLPAGAPGSRAEAYRQLSLIADYLARTEPHSPVPYVIRRVVEWGDMPLSDLLDELIKADAESRRVWSLLGVLR
ncbi:type VI secretion system protein TssA [Stutzerimonas kirkiae]|uniref:type VI secretion system protein TssA n=1 Tax=Stutzerimonas kirkiae TaxID=2211392 RepID=UPI00103835FF|nr:type VI secretion system protein TssA [Stutzerimonas kirkiae]TBV10808.1 type VI secretion system protein TssA [Stutzerimonas kirkiae]